MSDTTERAETADVGLIEAAVNPRKARPVSDTLAGRVLARGGLVFALVLAVAVFGAMRPSAFLSIGNLQSILLQSAAPGILAVGLTIPLIMNDFDLSIGSMLGLSGAASVALMSFQHATWGVAVAVGLVIGVAGGLINGLLIAYAKVSSFVVTLAMGTILLGVEFGFTDQKTIYQGVDPTYTSIGQSVPALGLGTPFWVFAVIAIIVWLVLERTEIGRYVYSVGGNPEAATFAGLNVRRIRAAGFLFVALAAAVAGLLVTMQSGSSSPNAGAAYLLPAFAAAFLGSAAFRPGEFNIGGTVVAVLFLGVVGTGLQMIGQSTSFINVVQGLILVAAMFFSRLGQGSRA